MTKPNRRAVLGGLAATLAAPAIAQAPWPNRPVKLIVPPGFPNKIPAASPGR